MNQINKDYQRLPGSYLFAEVKRRQEAYETAHPDQNVIRLGVGDVTLPLAPAVIEALHKAVDEQADAATFKGYAPDHGYDFLREAIQKNDFAARGADVKVDEIVISDGAKSDSSNIQEIFGPDIKIAVGDPVYPVYIDSNIMAGRGGDYNEETGKWSDLVYLSATAENDFKPALPEEPVDLVYLCYPNNPTGTTLNTADLQKWVDWANENDAILIFDSAYESFITEDDVPHSIFELPGSRTCAIEIRSFSKRAGFTGVRLGATIIPQELEIDGVSLLDLWKRRISTKFNGAPYIVQRAGEASYSEEGKAQIEEMLAYYRRNAILIKEGLEEAGYEVFGGVNAPYVWLKTPQGMDSWDFFDFLLEKAQIVGTPGVGFGPSGAGYFRLTAFNTYEKTAEAVERIKALNK
ncbi:MAG: LL-diaminopimelate aminotransferase [Aerococcus urinaeequi]